MILFLLEQEADLFNCGSSCWNSWLTRRVKDLFHGQETDGSLSWQTRMKWLEDGVFEKTNPRWTTRSWVEDSGITMTRTSFTRRLGNDTSTDSSLTSSKYCNCRLKNSMPSLISRQTRRTTSKCQSRLPYTWSSKQNLYSIRQRIGVAALSCHLPFCIMYLFLPKEDNRRVA